MADVELPQYASLGREILYCGGMSLALETTHRYRSLWVTLL
jgi:hypothetical protein